MVSREEDRPHPKLEAMPIASRPIIDTNAFLGIIFDYPCIYHHGSAAQDVGRSPSVYWPPPPTEI
jgi:hypothetical protein